ncbi:MAG: hypothetical protein HZB44_00195 [Actinobacteria bacterium]|nr:hypothetical protein [Actinomycetota bacterium]
MGILLGGVFELVLIGVAFDFAASGGEARTFTVSSAATPAYQTSIAGNAARAAQTLQASRAAAAAEAARQAQAAQEASASQAAAADGSTTADMSAAGYTEEEILAYLAANGYGLSGGGSGDYYIPPSTGFSPWTGNNGETWASGNASW